MRLRTMVAAALLLACACAAKGAPPRPIGQQADVAPPPPPPVGTSTAPHCAGPDEAIGVCGISADGVMIQARNLRPGAPAAVQLDGEYAAAPLGCRGRWHQELTIDGGGVVTARFDLPRSDRCALLASMVVRVYVLPDGPDLGPRRFGTIPPP